MTAAHQWLDLRVPFDDAARQASLPLVDRVATALCDDAAGTPVTIIDIGAGTGNSARWFQQHLTPRLPDADLRWVLVDSDRQALETASQILPGVQAVCTDITELPRIVDDQMASHPGKLLITGSAILDVFTRQDLAAIVDTLNRHNGLALILLSITGTWQLTPADPEDETINQAFCGHQQRHGKLGPVAPAALQELAHEAGASVTTARSDWQLTGPRDASFMTRFLRERVDAAIEHQPQLESLATEWLHRRLEQSSDDLRVDVEHLDVVIDARQID